MAGLLMDDKRRMKALQLTKENETMKKYILFDHDGVLNIKSLFE
jgi:hypothetical protein